MSQTQTQYYNPDIEAYRLGLLSDTQGLVRNQQIGRQVQGLRGQINPDTNVAYTDAEIAGLLSTPGSGTEGEDGYVAPTNYDPEYISSISRDAVFQPPDQKVAGLTTNQTDAIDLAARGVGSYKPYVESGLSTLNQGIGSVNAGRNMVGQGTTLGGIFAQEGMNDLQNAGINSQTAAGQYAGGMTDQAALTQGELSGLGGQALASGAQTGATLGGLGTSAQNIATQGGSNLLGNAETTRQLLGEQGTGAQNIAAQGGNRLLDNANLTANQLNQIGAGSQFIAGQARNKLNQIGSSAQGVADRAIVGGANVLGNQRAGLAQSEGMMNQAVAGGQQGLDTGTANARAGTGRATDALYGAGQAATGIAADTTARARNLNAPLESRLGSSTQGGLSEAAQGQLGADQAAYLARQSTAAAQGQLGQAANFGLGTAKSGIAQLAGASAQFDPSGIGAYNSPYQDEVVASTLADLERVAARRERDARESATNQAVSMGAFGSSGYQRALDRSVDPIREELDRNTASTVAQLRSQGYESSAQRAQAAFENARNRQIQTAQATGQLGQGGAGTSASAAQAGGQLGLGAESLAQGSALQGAALGLDARKFESANAQAIAATGLSIEQLSAQTGLNAQQIAGNFAKDAGQLNLSTEQLASQNAEAGAKLGMSGAQFKAANEASLAQTGMSVEQLAASTGMNAKQLAGTLAQQAGALGLQGQQQAGTFAGQAGNMYGTAAQQAAALGLQGQQIASANTLSGGNMYGTAAQNAAALGLQGNQLAQGATTSAGNAIMQGINTASSNALQGGQMGIGAQQGAGNLRLAGENQAIGAASNYANLGLDYGSMNQAGGAALGNLGSQLGTMGIQQAGMGELEQSLRRNDVSDLLTTGGIKQTNDQAVLDAIKMNDMQRYQLPFQETGFLGDIYAGVPTSSSTVTSGSTNNASPFMQAATLGIGGLSAAAGASRAGLF